MSHSPFKHAFRRSSKSFDAIFHGPIVAIFKKNGIELEKPGAPKKHRRRQIGKA